MNLLLAALAVVASAVIEEHTATFTLNSETSGEWSVSTTVVVNDEKGMAAAEFFLYCDSFRTLKSFGGTVTPANGKVVKLRMSDLERDAYSPGLVDDGVTYGYSPSGHFPLTVHYEYKVAYRGGFSSFPAFFPVETAEVSLREASYVLDVPAGYAVKYVSARTEFAKETVKNRDVYRWTVKDFSPLVRESMMPPSEELLPYVYCSPESINLGGFPGMQRDWNELGKWLYSLQTNSLELSPEEVKAVRELTAGCQTTLEKLSRLYDYLRERTRYVSIQLGIGGLKPIPAKEVSRVGYGDCKGLSNYLRALLAAVDVPSDYFIISTSQADLRDEYASVGQMNHAMLAVPVPELSDTAWVECTNPVVPLGYRHEDAAGHQVVLVKESGGELLRIPSYPDSLSLVRQVFEVNLFSSGSAEISARRELFLDYVEGYLTFRDQRPQRQISRLTQNLKIQAEDVQVGAIQDNFADYATLGKAFVPEMQIPYSFRTGSYASVSGDRLFVPVNPYAQAISIQKSARVNDLYQRGVSRWEECVKVQIPMGYRAESIPAPVVLDTEWGSMESQVTLSPGGTEMEVRQTFTIKAFRAPASSYASFRDFARAVNRAYSATAVFVKE